MDNGYQCTCSTQEGKSKSCCSTPCLYQDQLKGYRCYSGKTQIQCSPQYSLITAKGNRCRDDHPCATYGKDYYWCFIDSKSWEYCSPPRCGEVGLKMENTAAATTPVPNTIKITHGATRMIKLELLLHF